MKTKIINHPLGYKAPGIFRQCGKHSELLKIQDRVDNGDMITKEQLKGF